MSQDNVAYSHPKHCIQVVILLLCLLITGCVSMSLNDNWITVSDKDLTQQQRSGDGEGLAKPVPGQPLLINNSLVFSTMGDAVLGIAIATSTIKRTVDLFNDMQALETMAWTRQAIARLDSPQWQAMSADMQSSGRQLMIEPYAYLHGHPSAILQVRMAVSEVGRSGVLWTEQLIEKSQKKPLEGESSWSANHAQALVDFTRQALPTLLSQLPDVFAKYSQPPVVE